MNEKASATIEDYLSVLYILERDGEPVVGARLAELLKVTPPTVTNTLKRMIRDGLVIQLTSHAPQLTEQGRAMAQSVMRRHMLAEWMLKPLVSWSRLHVEAHGLEHAISAEVEKALIKNLSAPELCPHGNPLPGYEDAVSAWFPLTRVTEGEQILIRRIHEFAENSPSILSFLEENHIFPGIMVDIQKILPFNQTITILAENHEVSLGFAVAQYIYVERLSPEQKTR